MNAIFKTKDKLLITGSDRDERLLIKEFINSFSAKTANVTALVDINGEETGLALELVEAETDVSEPTTPSE